MAAFTKLNEAPSIFPPPVEIKTNKSFFSRELIPVFQKKYQIRSHFPKQLIAAEVPVIEKADNGGRFAPLKVH